MQKQRFDLTVGTHYTVECLDSEGRQKWAEEFDNLVTTEGRNALLGRTFDVVGSDVLWYVGLVAAGTGTVAITSGAATVTGTTTSFSAADVGSDIIIKGAGAAGADLVTTVATFTSATSITTTANAGATVSGVGYAVEARPADTMASKSFNEGVPYSNATRPVWAKNGAPSAGAMSNSTSRASFTVNATAQVYGAFMSSNNTKSGTLGILYGQGLFVAAGARGVVSGDTINVQSDPSITAS